MGRRNVNRTKQKILEIKREKPDNAARQFFTPAHDLMHIRKISFYLPNAFTVFGAMCITSVRASLETCSTPAVDLTNLIPHLHEHFHDIRNAHWFFR
jgi:hypothetical protein